MLKCSTQIAEQLNYQIEDFHKFPEGSLQRAIQKQIINAYSKRYSIELPKNPEYHIQKNSLDELKRLFQQKMGSIPSDINQTLNKLKNNSSLYGSLCVLKKKIIGIDTLELERLIDKTKESEKSIEGKDAVIFVGNTGSGKSTAILKFLGYELKKGKQNSINTLVPTRQLEPQHQSFHTSPQAKSCTRYINAAPFPKHLYPSQIPENKRTLVICDSPGFGDSAGAQVDIANGVGMINALRKSKSVRIVLILPYHSLKADRSNGLVNISELITNLFKNLKNIQSCAVLFNMVPQDQIKQIPQIVKNKTLNLNQLERANQKLVAFLKFILQKSKQQINFYSPFKNNEKNIFKKIYQINPITNVSTNLQYQFSMKTKQQIERYTKSQQRKIKDYFYKQSWEEAQYHLKMLQKLKNILYTDKRISQSYKQAAKIIQQNSDRIYSHYQQLIKSAMNLQGLGVNQVALKTTFIKIQSISRLFSGFDSISVVSKEKIAKISKEIERNLQNNCKDISKINQNSINSVKIFSEIFKSNLKIKIVNILQAKFIELFKHLKYLINQNKYEEMRKQIIQINKISKYVIIINGGTTLQTSESRKNQLKESVQKYVDKAFSFIEKLMEQQPLHLTLRTIEQIKVKMKHIDAIASFNFTINFKQIKPKLKKCAQAILLKCKNYIKDLQQIKPKSDKNQVTLQKQKLVEKKNQIELLMKISFVCDDLKYQYQSTLENIKRKNEDNIQKLKKFVKGLKNHQQPIYRRIESIKKSINIVIQYCEIIDQKFNVNQIIQPINQQFIQYLSYQARAVKKLDIKKMQDLQQYYSKIRAYQKIKILGQKVIMAVVQIKKIFIKKLKSPFQQMKQYWQSSMQGRQLKSITFILEGLQELSNYSFKMQQMLTPKEYDQISSDQEDIKKYLTLFSSQIKIEVQKFIHSQDQKPDQIKNLIRTLVTISTKIDFAKYLRSYANFDVFSQINRINTKFQAIEQELRDKFQKTQKTVHGLQLILKECNFHLQNQGLMKKQQKILSKLQKECQQQIQRLLKSDEEKITEELTDKKPTKIEFQYLKAEHEKFGKLNSKEGKQKTSLIEKGLKQIEEKYLKNFEEIEGQIGTNPQRRSQLLEIYPQLATLQENLTKFYNESKITSQLKERAQKHITSFFVQKYKKLFKALQTYNIIKYKQLLKTFINLQLKIYRLLPIQILLKENKKNVQQLKQAISQLKQFIKNHQKIGVDQKKRSANTSRLTELMIIFEKGFQKQIGQIYCNKDGKMKIDRNFIQYYNGVDQYQKKDLQTIVKDHFKGKVSSFIQELDRSAQNAENKKIEIQQLINLLPKGFGDEYISILKNQQNQYVNKVKLKIKKQVGQFSPESDRFFKAAKALLEKGQKELYQRYVSEFAEIYASSEKGLKTVDEKLNFVQLYFIKLCQTQHKQLSSHRQMYEIYLNQFQRWHQTILKKQPQIFFDQLSRFFENPLAKQSQLLDDLRIKAVDQFKIYTYIISLQVLPFIDVKQIKTIFRELYLNKFKDCVKTYNSYFKNRKDVSLSAQLIFTKELQEKIKKYFVGLTQIGRIMDSIAIEINKTVKIEQKFKFQHCLKMQLNFIKDYKDQINFFKDQMYQTKYFLNKFAFFNDTKRNMSPKDLKQDLTKLNKQLKSFKQKQILFDQLFRQNELPLQIQFTFRRIQTEIQQKFDHFVEQAQEQIKTVFQEIQTDPISKITLLKNQLQIMKQNQLSFIFIKKQKVNNTINLVKTIIDSSFKKAESEIKGQLQSLKPAYQQIKKNKKKLGQKQGKQIDEVNTKYQKQLEQNIKKEKQKATAALLLQTDEDKKIQIKNNEQTELNNIKKDVEEKKSKQIEAIRTKFLQESYKIKNVQDLSKKFCKNLIIFQKALIDIIDTSQSYRRSFQQILKNIKRISTQFINIIEKNLENSTFSDPRSIGKYILFNNKNYFNFSLNKIHELIKGQDIAYVLRHLEKIQIDRRKQIQQNLKNSILQIYNLFKRQYENIKEEYKAKPQQVTITYIITPLKQLARSIEKKPSRDNKVRLLAGIFALWVCLKSEQIETGEVKFTIEPHPTQITTLLLLLGIAQKEEGLSNRLAQVGTGEGKSIVLAGLCSYLALLGYDVRCACYSLYLSTRDESNFRELFLRLGVEKKVRYGTFNELCEDVLNSGGQSLKEEVEKMILSENEFSKASKNFKQKFAALKGKSEGNQTILVIDEVDVFFEENFFGKSYCPAISLKGEEVEQLIKHVWKEVREKGIGATADQIISSTAFLKLKNKYPHLHELLINQVHGMIAGAINFSHDYSIVDKKICYKDNDSISHNMNFGYKTVFANLYEYEKGSVSQLNLANSLQISLMFAQFSYAQLPSYFRSILGVTGTLQVLPKYKKRLLVDRYGIREQYAIPSAFGINKKRVQRYTIRPQQQYQEAIVEKITEVKDRRPIIVFFKGPKELNEFFNCSAYEPFKGRTYSLTEFHDAATRDSRIVTAVNPNNITLMSSAFGRGTDFVLLDDKINDLGGLHVIQAFLSLEESEEVQIKGRTARQNSKGSYDCVISSSWLQQLKIKPENIIGKQLQIIKKSLLSAREAKVESQSKWTIDQLSKAQLKHQQIVQTFSKQKLTLTDLVQYISKMNSYPLLKNLRIKTILGLDATGSMSFAIKRTCQIIGDSFQRSYEVLKRQKVQAIIQVKIKIYRNYDCQYQEILQGTSFENTPINLKNFLQNVQAKCGWGHHEAVQVFFYSVNQQSQINQVILIGDAAPNNESQVQEKRMHRGQHYWTTNGFPKTNINLQLNKLMIKKCPVHSFYLPGGQEFQQISYKTGGKAQAFQIESPKVTQNLTQFIVENILQITQKQSGTTANLVETYRKMYVR